MDAGAGDVLAEVPQDSHKQPGPGGLSSGL